MKARKCHLVKRSGSALILTVVLTTLLAVVGVAFLLMSRVDNMATTAQHENRELEFAAQSVIATISDTLVRDVPGVELGQEYWDHDGPFDPWLASIEPYDANEGTGTEPDYRWRQISEINNYLSIRRGRSGNTKFFTRNIPIEITTAAKDPNNQYNAIIPERKPLVLDPNGRLDDQLADADGDGVADSKWIMLHGVVSSKSQPVFAAVRIIDNGGLLNVNTGFKFDANDPNVLAGDPNAARLVDGSSLMQVNLMGLSWRPGHTFYKPLMETDLLMERSGGLITDPCQLGVYERQVVWRYDDPNLFGTPFDIADELELRNRYVLNHSAIDARIEEMGNSVGRSWDFRTIEDMRMPVDTPAELRDWFKTTYTAASLVDPNIDPNYAYRHLATTYNMDRIINPTAGLVNPLLRVNGGRQANINTDSVTVIYNALRAALQAGGAGDSNDVAAQLAVNIIDYRDPDPNIITTLTVPTGPNSVPRTFFGFEPQPFISEIAYRISGSDPNNTANNYFAVELYNPFEVDLPLSSFRLQMRRSDGTVVSEITVPSFYVIQARDRFVFANSSAAVTAFGITGVSVGKAKVDSRLVLATYVSDPNVVPPAPPRYLLAENFDIFLTRPTPVEPNLFLDRQLTQQSWFDWARNADLLRYYSRPDDNGNVVYQDTMALAGRTLGSDNLLGGTERNYNLSAGGRGFATVGDIARVLKVGPSGDPNDMFGVTVQGRPGESAVRLDCADDTDAVVFQYVTVLDPNSDGIDNDADMLVDGADVLWPEWKVPGRVNVNTAPWFVIAQLPWIQRNMGVIDPWLARSIVRQRNAMGGFTSVADLLQVTGINRYLQDNVDMVGYPDLTPGDGSPVDFEERDVIFSRVSNLATVRSDVFTAYILVRIGVDGPQKRVMAILDRSEVYGPSDKVKIRAYQSIRDPR